MNRQRRLEAEKQQLLRQIQQQRLIWRRTKPLAGNYRALRRLLAKMGMGTPLSGRDPTSRRHTGDTSPAAADGFCT